MPPTYWIALPRSIENCINTVSFGSPAATFSQETWLPSTPLS